MAFLNVMYHLGRYWTRRCQPLSKSKYGQYTFCAQRVDIICVTSVRCINLVYIKYTSWKTSACQFMVMYTCCIHQCSVMAWLYTFCIHHRWPPWRTFKDVYLSWGQAHQLYIQSSSTEALKWQNSIRNRALLSF